MTRFTAVVDGAARTMVLRADAIDGSAPIETDRAREWDLLNALTRQGGAPDARRPLRRHHRRDAWQQSDRPGLRHPADLSCPGFGRARTPIWPRLHRRCATLAADIHLVEVGGMPSTIEHPEDWNSYIDELIELWRRTERDLSGSIPMLRYVAAWLERNRPTELPMTLVHGEFQPGNVMFGSEGRLIAVDWEFAHIGDPAGGSGLGVVGRIDPAARADWS